MNDNDEGQGQQFEMYDNLSEFIDNYEDTKKRKKKPVKKTKGAGLFIEEEPPTT